VLQFHTSAFLHLEMWADIIDLLGLTVLLSYDVAFLKTVLDIILKFPKLQRTSALKANLLKKLVEFYRTMHGPMMPETLDTLEGADASIFMKTFSEWRGKSVPKSGIKVCILYLTQGATGEPWIYAGSTSEEVRVESVSAGILH
jgi:hypothetical protein